MEEWGINVSIARTLFRHDLPRRMVEKNVEGELVERSCEECVTNNNKARGTTESVPSSGHEDATDRGYEPWVVVNQKKNGTRNQKSGGASVT